MIKTADGKEILEDGEHLIVRTTLMDSLQKAVVANDTYDTVLHKPGFVVRLSDADAKAKQAMYDAADKTLTERWRGQAPKTSAPTVDRNSASITFDARVAAYSAYERRITDAWRHR